MNLNIKVTGSEKIQQALLRLAGSVARQEMATGLNVGANAYLKPAMQQELSSRVDRVTPFVLNSVRLVQRATPDNLTISVGPTYGSKLGTKGGKVGVDPQQILQALEFGGGRRDKRSENALMRVGILPRGMQTAIPAKPFPGSDDGNGNLRGPFLVQLIAYFQAFGEQGYKSNMKDKTKRALERGSKKSIGRRYFVAYGKLRGGARMTRRGEYDERASNLAPGIWAVVGKTGADVRPVLMFVRRASYKPQIDMSMRSRIGTIEQQFGSLIRARIYKAAGL